MRLAVILLTLVLASKSGADEFEERRGSCVPLVTAVYEDCTFHNYRRCAGGEIYIEQMSRELPPVAMLYGPDYELIYQRNMLGGPSINAVLEARDRFSLSQFLTSGTDEIDIIVDSSMAGFSQNARMQSVLEKTTETYTVSDKVLEVVLTTMTLEMGFAGNSMTVVGRGYFEPDQQLFFPGPSDYEFSGAALFRAPELIQISYANEPHFMSQSTEAACSPNTAMLKPNALIMENHHDHL